MTRVGQVRWIMGVVGSGRLFQAGGAVAGRLSGQTAWCGGTVLQSGGVQRVGCGEHGALLWPCQLGGASDVCWELWEALGGVVNQDCGIFRT